LPILYYLSNNFKVFNLKSESASNKLEASRKTKEDFEFLKEIGDGSFSTVFLYKSLMFIFSYSTSTFFKVYLAKEKKTGQLIASKSVDLKNMNSFQ